MKILNQTWVIWIFWKINISFKGINDKSDAVTIQVTDEWKKYLGVIIQDKEPKNILNVSESVSFLSALLIKLLLSKLKHAAAKN